MAQQGTRYRIQTVADMTGIPAATLRAWERRYGVPSPERTASSYRLYSEDDIRLIRKIRELCDEGMSPSEAAKIVQRVAVHEELQGRDDTTADPFTAARTEILSAVRSFNVGALDLAVQRTLLLGSAHAVFSHVLGPVMRTIGDLWHEGELSVAQEHMASEVLGRTARDILRLIQPDPPEGVAVLACFADEDHAFPLFGVALAVTQWRIRPVVLGARTPPTAIKHAVQELDPVFVGLSITTLVPAHRARELIDGYAAACGSTPWIVGGATSPGLREAIVAAGGHTGDIDALKKLVVGIRRRSKSSRAR